MHESAPESARAGGALGTHVLIDGWGAPAALLDDAPRARAALTAAAQAVHATIIDVCVHRFSPRGITAVATLAESHLALHTWPELGYFAADLFYCGRGDLEPVVETLARALGAEEVRVRRLPRGPGLGAGTDGAVIAVPTAMANAGPTGGKTSDEPA